jgi:hypothetical protein
MAEHDEIAQCIETLQKAQEEARRDSPPSVRIILIIYSAAVLLFSIYNVVRGDLPFLINLVLFAILLHVLVTFSDWNKEIEKKIKELKEKAHD